MIPYTTLVSIVACGGWLMATGAACWAEPVDFQRDVAPILQQRCVRCHNDREQRGGLSLESAEGAGRGGENGRAIRPGDATSSLLLDYLIPIDGQAEMPKGEEPLSAEQIDTIRRWIAEGAVWPPQVRLQPPRLWSLRPIIRPAVPPAEGGTKGFSVRNPIDAFVAVRHRENGLQAAVRATRRTLVRRLYLDLLGLPPEPAAIDAFLADSRPAAYERLVERLLESPHFGERWGRHWLDLARYADSEGYLGDSERPHAWVYRQWVIDALNRDLPFDQFTIEQLAGDLLEQPTLDQRVATGFHRNTLRNTEAGVDLELYRTKEVVDRVSTTGMVWLGLTLGCAECHDHKHDPLSQAEFYRLYAFFNNADEIGVPVSRPWQITEYQLAMRAWRPAWNRLLDELRSFETEDLSDDQRKQVSQPFSGSGNSLDWKMIAALYRTNRPGWAELKARVDAHFKKRPKPPSSQARAFAERKKERRETFVHIRGIYKQRGDRVDPGTPAILPALDARGVLPDRMDLAKWLFHEENPLTARVAVNRVWQHLFGQGLVSTPNDFGNQGARPTHPRLLDWLATEYRRLGWSRKALIRLIVTSSTYQLASAANAVPSQQHLSNQLLWRQNSYRVSAEIIRDLHLAASGLLDRTIGRRGIRPPLPAFVTEVGRSVKWPVSRGGEQHRRGMYIFFKRTVPYPMLMTFDAPDSTVSCSRRERSNTPLQALTLLNDAVFYACAQALGGQAVEQHPADPQATIEHIFLRCLGRRPREPERTVLAGTYQDLLRLKRGESQAGAADADPKVAALVAVTRIIMNLDEFVTRD